MISRFFEGINNLNAKNLKAILIEKKFLMEKKPNLIEIWDFRKKYPANRNFVSGRLLTSFSVSGGRRALTGLFVSERFTNGAPVSRNLTARALTAN